MDQHEEDSTQKTVAPSDEATVWHNVTLPNVSDTDSSVKEESKEDEPKDEEEPKKDEPKEEDSDSDSESESDSDSDSDSECECDSDCPCKLLEEIECPMCDEKVCISKDASSFQCPHCHMDVDIQDISESDSDSGSDSNEKVVNECSGFVLYSFKMLAIIYLIKLILYLFEKDGSCNCICAQQSPWRSFQHYP